MLRSLRVKLPTIHIDATTSSQIGILHPCECREAFGRHKSTLKLSNFEPEQHLQADERR
jgi:hypothetical protein